MTKKPKIKLYAPPSADNGEGEVETHKTQNIEKQRKESATEDQIARVESQDEAMKKLVVLKPTYQVVNLGGGDRCRIIGKAPQGNWVSPVISLGEASRLCKNMNRKDPEQQRLLRDKAEAPIMIDTGEGTVENPRMIIKRQRK